MKRRLATWILLGAVCLMHAASAGHNFGVSFDVAVGGGYSSLGSLSSNLSSFSVSPAASYGLNAHVGANIFFCEYVGLGIGADVARYGGAVCLNGKQSWPNVTDTDGENYTHHLSIEGWKERVALTYVAPGASLLFAAPVGPIHLSAAVGAEYGFYLGGSYDGGGSLTHSGFYAPWNLTREDLPDHGFYTETRFHPKGKTIDCAPDLFVTARLGVLIPLIEHLDLTAHVMAKYGLLGQTAVGGHNSVGFRDDREGMADAHYFMTDYQSLLTTPIVSGDVHPLLIGAEIGLRYTIPFKPYQKKSRHKCMCWKGY